MKLKLYDSKKTEIGSKDLPMQFYEPVREDLIKRVYLAILSHIRQPFGADPEAGKRTSAKLSRRRRNYRGSYGHGISRVPRKIMSRKGMRMNWVGAFAPGMVGGRRAHPYKAEKIWYEKVNKKENQKAIRSAIAATINKELVKARGHIIPDIYPFIISSKVEEMMKTKEIKEMLEKFGFANDMERTSERKVRAGKGKSRGRKYKSTKKSLLIVVSKPCPIMKSAANIPGIEIVAVDRLNVKLLAPGTNAGRATLFTDAAVERMEKEKLFTKERIFEKLVKTKIKKETLKKSPSKKPVKK
jgi:large subunit ribosomal protein L4e